MTSVKWQSELRFGLEPLNLDVLLSVSLKTKSGSWETHKLISEYIKLMFERPEIYWPLFELDEFDLDTFNFERSYLHQNTILSPIDFLCILICMEGFSDNPASHYNVSDVCKGLIDIRKRKLLSADPQSYTTLISRLKKVCRFNEFIEAGPYYDFFESMDRVLLNTQLVSEKDADQKPKRKFNNMGLAKIPPLFSNYFYARYIADLLYVGI